MSPASRYALTHGASWVMTDGRVIHLVGFHENWLRSHPGLASGTTNTADFVKYSGWISAVLHDQGYLELIVRSRGGQAERDSIWNIVEANAASLSRVVLMTLGEEGFIALLPPDFTDRDAFEAALGRGPA